MKMKIYARVYLSIIILLIFLYPENSIAQITSIGSGSYTTTFPGVDAANRNSFPSGTPYVIGTASTKPVPTNDWWSLKIKEAHVNNMFNYPMALGTRNEGMIVAYIEAPSGANGSSQPMGDAAPVIVGVIGLNASEAMVYDHSDFTVSLNWTNDAHSFSATMGIAMPFIYYEKADADEAQITVNTGTVTIQNEILIIEDAQGGADFAVFAPSGSTWETNGNAYTSTLNGENYWSLAHLPKNINLSTVAESYKKYAYVFPTNTTTVWEYDEASSVCKTTFTVSTTVKEGSNANMLLGLLPHQWGNLAAGSAQPNEETYTSIRGQIKTLDGNTFSVENTYRGILPTLPYLNNYSQGFNPAQLDEKIKLIENDGLSSWTDSYNEGQVMNRLIQTARIADLTGDVVARDKMIATVKERLEDWLTAESSEVAFIFYYNDTWSTLIGYPAGHGQDGNINDHHFHWGYFIHAAAFMEQFEPGWAAEWGDMINYLVRDAASPNRDDELFPFLRNFSPYAGHCWANGFATFPFGNDQESTSESMQFNSSLIHWGTITGNDEIRDLGIYLYTTEQTAIEEYWMDVNEQVFKPEYNFSMVSRCWGNGYDNQTFWTSDIAAVYGIEMYPIHGGSLYLGHNLSYAEKLWKEITENTGILENEANANLWHDVMWEYLAFFDPAKAIELYNSYPERGMKFGISEAQTYYWLHAMNAMGSVDPAITANYPIAAAFTKDGATTYTAHNYGSQELVVKFSDGFELAVPAKSMATNKDVSIAGTLSSSFYQAFVNGSVELSVEISQGNPSKVEFYNGEVKLGEVSQAPYTFSATQLNAGKHSMYARIYENEDFSVTNIVTIIVGQQLPYIGMPWSIPGEIEAGKYDKFEGGNGQGIAYNDVSAFNEGDFRTTEYVDASTDLSEGSTVGWISSGEWLEYTIMVEKSGYYTLDFRYASGNGNGGGPFDILLDNQMISEGNVVSSTSDWDAWKSKSLASIPLAKGEHILKLDFISGEFNLAKMTFTFENDLDYSQPVANAGDNVLVLLPATTTSLHASNSYDPELGTLSYTWEQQYGPSKITFSDAETANPTLSNLVEGIYLVKLNADNGMYMDSDEVFIIVSATGIIAPTVSIISPENNSEYIVGSNLSINAEAFDLDGSIASVEFFANEASIGTDSVYPFAMEWNSDQIQLFYITAKATDNEGNSSLSNAIKVTFTEAPPCDGVSENGDYSYLFTGDDNNPSLTFIPVKSGMGSPTCILYYGTNSSEPFAGQNVDPNQAVKINASEGEKVYFYYTYTHPEGGERNTIDQMNSYVVGSCLGEVDTTSTKAVKFDAKDVISYYPNPVSGMLNLSFPEGLKELTVFDMTGRVMESLSLNEMKHQIPMEHYPKGLYVVLIQIDNQQHYVKIVKE